MSNATDRAEHILGRLHLTHTREEMPEIAPEIAEALGYAPSTVLHDLERLAAAGKVQQLGVAGRDARTWGLADRDY